MQTTKFKMVSYNVKTAKSRLKQHQQMGIHSPLSIFDVANLLDIIQKGESYVMPSNQPSIFQSIGFN